MTNISTTTSCDHALAPFLIGYQCYFCDKISERLFSTLKSYHSQMYVNVDDNSGLLGEKQNPDVYFRNVLEKTTLCRLTTKPFLYALPLPNCVVGYVEFQFQTWKNGTFQDAWTILKEYVAEPHIFLSLSSINLRTDGSTLFLGLAFCFKNL